MRGCHLWGLEPLDISCVERFLAIICFENRDMLAEVLKLMSVD
jgi:hypothetical protein